MLLLLSLLCVLFLSDTSLLAQSLAKVGGVPETCPVTKPSDQPFVPPFPIPAKQDKGNFWFGTDRLWTQLPANGTWNGLPHPKPNESALGQKLFFGRQGYNAFKEPLPKLRVAGKRLDALAPPLLASRATSAIVKPDEHYMLVGAEFPTLGCWEVTAHYEDDELTFVVWITK